MLFHNTLYQHWDWLFKIWTGFSLVDLHKIPAVSLVDLHKNLAWSYISSISSFTLCPCLFSLLPEGLAARHQLIVDLIGPKTCATKNCKESIQWYLITWSQYFIVHVQTQLFINFELTSEETLHIPHNQDMRRNDLCKIYEINLSVIFDGLLNQNFSLLSAY